MLFSLRFQFYGTPENLQKCVSECVSRFNEENPKETFLKVSSEEIVSGLLRAKGLPVAFSKVLESHPIPEISTEFYIWDLGSNPCKEIRDSNIFNDFFPEDSRFEKLYEEIEQACYTRSEIINDIDMFINYEDTIPVCW